MSERAPTPGTPEPADEALNVSDEPAASEIEHAQQIGRRRHEKPGKTACTVCRSWMDEHQQVLQLQSEVDFRGKAIVELKAAVEKRDIEISQLLHDRDNRKETEIMHESIINDLRAQIVKLTSERDAITVDRDNVKEELRVLEKRFRKLKAKEEEVIRATQKLLADNEVLAEQVALRTEERKALEAERVTLRESVAEAQDRGARLEVELRRACEEAAQLETQRDAALLQIDDLEGVVVDLQGRFETKKVDYTEVERERDQWNDAAVRMSTEYDKLLEAFKATEREKQTTIRRITVEAAQRSVVESDMARLVGEVEAARKREVAQSERANIVVEQAEEERLALLEVQAAEINSLKAKLEKAEWARTDAVNELRDLKRAEEKRLAAEANGLPPPTATATGRSTPTGRQTPTATAAGRASPAATGYASPSGRVSPTRRPPSPAGRRPASPTVRFGNPLRSPASPEDYVPAHPRTPSRTLRTLSPLMV